MTVAVEPLFDPDVIVAKVDDHDVRYPPVEAGARFVKETLEYSAEFVAAMLNFSEIDPDLYKGEIPPGLMARRTISVIGSALFNQHPERGYVHTVQGIESYLPVPADEPITMTGRFSKIEDHARGWIMHGDFEFRRADGELALLVSPRALMADPERNTSPTKAPKADEPSTEERMAELAADGWTQATTKTCTPERVVGYCGKTRNLIHTDPDYAKTFGFRAPITAGNQMIDWHLETVRRAMLGHRFEGRVRLERPVFWDDALQMLTRKRGAALEIACVKADGRIANRSRFSPL